MGRINLLPRELCPGLKVDPRRFAVIIAAILAGGLILAVYVGFTWHISRLQEELDDLQRQLAGLNVRAGLAEDIRLEREKYQAMAQAYTGLVNGKKNWLDMLVEIDQHVPPEVWLTEIRLSYEPVTCHYITNQDGQLSTAGSQVVSSEDKANAVNIQGKAWSMSAVGALAVNLSGLPFFETVKLHSVSSSPTGPVDFFITAYTRGEAP